MDDGTLPVISDDRRHSLQHFLQRARRGGTRLGHDIETERVAKPLQLRVQLPVEFIGGASRTDQIAGAGQFPAPQQPRQARFGHGPLKGREVLRDARHLDNIQRLDLVILEVVLHPFDAIEAIQQSELRREGEGQDRHPLLVRLVVFEEEIKHLVGNIFLGPVHIDDERKVGPAQVQYQQRPQPGAGPPSPASGEEPAKDQGTATRQPRRAKAQTTRPARC